MDLKKRKPEDFTIGKKLYSVLMLTVNMIYKYIKINNLPKTL